MNTIARYTTVRVSGTFRDTSTGNLVDPTSVSLNLVDPTGQMNAVGATKDSTGMYHYDWTPQTPGVWNVQFQGSGAVVVANVPVSVYVI